MEPVRGRLGDQPGMGTLKTTKKSLFETLILEHICDRCWYFWGHVFYLFLLTLYFHHFCSGRRSQVSTEPVFGLLRTPNKWISGKSETIQKPLFLQWFRHIQPLHSAIMSICFVFWMSIFWFTSCCVYCFNDFAKFNTFLSPLGLHFSTHFQHFQASISRPKKSQKSKSKAESRGGHLRHILGKGGTGRHPGDIWEASWRHLGGIWRDQGGSWRQSWGSRAPGGSWKQNKSPLS